VGTNCMLEEKMLWEHEERRLGLCRLSSLGDVYSLLQRKKDERRKRGLTIMDNVV